MTLSNRAKILSLLGILALIGALPLILYMQSQQQETRSKAAQSTSLFFTPATTSTSPLAVVRNQTYTLDLMMNPGTNAVSTAKIDIQFDGRFVETFGANPVVINSTAFSQILEGPVISNSSIKFTVATGSDPSKAIKTTTKVATITFNARASTISPTEIAFGAIELLSVAAGDQANENVYAGGQSAFVAVDNFHINGRVIQDYNGNGKWDTPEEPQVPANFGYNITITKNGVSYPVTHNDNGNGQFSSQSDLARGTYLVTYTNPPSGVGIFPSPPVYTVTLGDTTCGVQPTGGDGGCNAGSVNSLNFALAIQPTPTVTPTPLPPTVTPTPIPATPTLTPTPTPVMIRFGFTVFLHGIGQSGDNTNENAFTLSNKNPLTTTKPIVVELFESDPITSASIKVLEKTGNITYQPTTGNYTGVIDIGTTLQAKPYTVKIKADKYFKKFGGNPTVNPSSLTTIQLPPTTLSAGDAFEDNNANINDYNLIYSCYSVDSPPRSCTAAQKYQADLNDDGNVNQYDYNLFLREIGNWKGE
ncbi:MAG: hypothetical protein RLZZ455_1136 [Candidatus Parcubacteria bacterium]|jgi:hypothetical protein